MGPGASKKSNKEHLGGLGDAHKKNKDKGVKTTVSIALPGSIIANAQSPELCTYLAGQIARTCAVFAVDEIVIFSENAEVKGLETQFSGPRGNYDPNVFLARILQYLDTPQYLRKALFPVHKDLRNAGLLNPLDAPHHLRKTEDGKYREGVTKKMPNKNGTWVDVGLTNFLHIPEQLRDGVRVTVEVEDHVGSASSRPPRPRLYGKTVAPSVPRRDTGVYWGYHVRLAERLGDVFSQGLYGQYDLILGTSERGENMCHADFKLPEYKHALIVFGGVGGIEDALLGDDRLDVESPDLLFDMYLNSCPNQGSRTIRTEEAIQITLAALNPHVLSNQA
jgi:predicted SPOUT superfamily RNA methylase MTH1